MLHAANMHHKSMLKPNEGMTCFLSFKMSCSQQTKISCEFGQKLSSHFLNIEILKNYKSLAVKLILFLLYLCPAYYIFKIMSGFMHRQSSSAIPPPPRSDPRELAFFENELANAPPPGQKSCSNAPG